MYRMLSSKSIALFSSKRTLGRDAIKAVWAEALFNEIQNCPQRRKYEQDKTLVDHLRSYQLPASSLQSLEQLTENPKQIEQVRQEMIKMFDPFTGVPLPDQIKSSQERFSAGLHPQKNRLSFYPNSAVTSPIFNIVSQQMYLGTRQLIQGKQGISKSLSLLLAWHLSKINVQFRYHHPTKVAELVRRNLLRAKFAKLIYISFGNQGKKSSYYLDLMKSQCPEAKELFEEFSNKLSKEPDGLRDFMDKLSKFYKQKHIPVLVIMDQINSLAKRFHDYNEYQKTNYQQIITEQKIKIRRQLYSEHNFYQAVKANLNFLMSSSSNIEENLLSNPNSSNHIYYALDVMQHTPITIRSCHYDRGDWVNIRQIYRFLWFQCSKHMSKRERSLQPLFINSCDELAARAKELNSLMTPLSINKALKIKNNLMDNVREQMTKFEQRFKELLQDVIKLKDQQHKINKIEVFVEQEFHISTYLSEENKFKLRTNAFIKGQVSLPYLSRENLYIHQKILNCKLCELKQESRQVLQKMKWILKTQKMVQTVEIQKLRNKVNEYIKHIIEKQAKLLVNPSRLPSTILSEANARIKDCISNQMKFKTEDELMTKILVLEFCELQLKKINEKNSIITMQKIPESKTMNINKQKRFIISQLKTAVLQILKQQKFQQIEKRLEGSIKIFIQNELNMRSLPRKKDELKSRIIEFTKSWKNLDSQQKESQVKNFIHKQLKSHNLPDLEKKLREKILQILQSIQKDIKIEELIVELKSTGCSPVNAIRLVRGHLKKNLLKNPENNK